MELLPERKKSNEPRCSGQTNPERQEKLHMTLGAFQPKSRIQGDKLDLKAYNGRPLLVRVSEFVPDFSSQAYPTPKPVVFCDAVDLYTGQIFINALFGAQAVVDNLKDIQGTNVVLPVRPVMKNSTKRAGTQYIALDALSEAELIQANQWYESSWSYVDQARAQREAAAVPSAPAAGITPAVQAPAQAFTPQGGYVPQAQVPAQQFAAPATQPPANPAYAPQAAPQGFGAPQAAPAVPPQGFGAPQAAPAVPAPAPQGFAGPQGGGLFTNQPPAPQPGQGFGQPVGDQAAANAAIAHLNAQVQGQ